MVAPIFRDTVTELLAAVEELNFVKQAWGDAEAARLARVLPLCHALRTLLLTGNGQIGDEGVRALAEACGGGRALARLTELRLSGNRIGDEGLRALADAVEKHGALPEIEQLHVNINVVGDTGVRSIASAAEARAFAKLRILNLQHNPVGEDGVAALVGALEVDKGVLPALRELHLPDQDGLAQDGLVRARLAAALRERAVVFNGQ